MTARGPMEVTCDRDLYTSLYFPYPGYLSSRTTLDDSRRRFCDPDKLLTRLNGAGNSCSLSCERCARVQRLKIAAANGNSLTYPRSSGLSSLWQKWRTEALLQYHAALVSPRFSQYYVVLAHLLVRLVPPGPWPNSDMSTPSFGLAPLVNGKMVLISLPTQTRSTLRVQKACTRFPRRRMRLNHSLHDACTVILCLKFNVYGAMYLSVCPLS